MDKFFNLKTAVAALSILLVAAILLGLMGYLSLRRQLGPGGTPPVTSAPGNSTPGEDSVATKGSYTLSLKDYGAKGDGKTDDTQAVKSWLAALKPGYTGYIPAGEYVFKEPLVGPQVKGVGIRGEGAQQSILVYQGDDRDCDLLTLGSDSKLTALTGWILQGFSVESDVRMIGGTALRLRWMQGGTRIMDVDISRLNKEKNLWDGVWFDCCNVATYDGFNINVRNEGVIVSGADDSDAASDVSLDHGAITFCTVGIHVGGGFGGLTDVEVGEGATLSTIPSPTRPLSKSTPISPAPAGLNLRHRGTTSSLRRCPAAGCPSDPPSCAIPPGTTSTSPTAPPTSSSAPLASLWGQEATGSTPPTVTGTILFLTANLNTTPGATRTIDRYPAQGRVFMHETFRD